MPREKAKAPKHADPMSRDAREDRKMVKLCYCCSRPQEYLCDGAKPEGGKCKRRLCERHASISGGSSYCQEHRIPPESGDDVESVVAKPKRARKSKASS